MTTDKRGGKKPQKRTGSSYRPTAPAADSTAMNIATHFSVSDPSSSSGSCSSSSSYDSGSSSSCDSGGF